MKEKRDWLDYLDFAAKIIGAIFVYIVTTYLQESNNLTKEANALKQQEIANAMAYGTFTQSLIKDMLVRDDSKLQSDLAFITLNRTIGDKDSTLIVELGIRLVKDFYESQQRKGKDSSRLSRDPNAIQTVENIVRERDSVAYYRILSIKDEYNRLNGLDQLITTKTNDPKIKNPPPAVSGLKATSVQSITEEISKTAWKKLTIVPSNGTVFIQVDKGKDSVANRNWANDLRRQINFIGFNAPGIEVVPDGRFPDIIKYYYESDKPAVDKLKAELVKFLPDKTIETKLLTNNKARMGTIELWVKR